MRASGGAFTGGSTPHLQPMMSPMIFIMVEMMMVERVKHQEWTHKKNVMMAEVWL